MVGELAHIPLPGGRLMFLLSGIFFPLMRIAILIAMLFYAQLGPHIAFASAFCLRCMQWIELVYPCMSIPFTPQELQ